MASVEDILENLSENLWTEQDGRELFVRPVDVSIPPSQPRALEEECPSCRLPLCPREEAWQDG